jgi:hypothetical protein
MPDAEIRDLNPTPVQFRQQFTAGDIWLFLQTGFYPGRLASQFERLAPPTGSAAGLSVSAGAASTGSPRND